MKLEHLNSLYTEFHFSPSEASDTWYEPYLHFCYELHVALETLSVLPSSLSGFMTSATPTH